MTSGDTRNEIEGCGVVNKFIYVGSMINNTGYCDLAQKNMEQQEYREEQKNENSELSCFTIFIYAAETWTILA